MSPFYLKKRTDTEAEHPQAAVDHGKIYRQLVAVGSLAVKDSPPIRDTGCGIELVGEAIGDALKIGFEFPRFSHLHLSLESHASAQSRLGATPEILYQYVSCNLKNIPLGSRVFVFCRFAFKSRTEPRSFFDKLVRLLQPGGREPERNHVTYCPLDADRRLHSFFHHSALDNTGVFFNAHHLFYGPLSATDGPNPAQTDPLMELQRTAAARLDADLGMFKEKFIEFLRSPGRFNYTPLVLKETRRPS